MRWCRLSKQVILHFSTDRQVFYKDKISYSCSTFIPFIAVVYFLQFIHQIIIACVRLRRRL